jgi:hypothetical protein
MRHRTGLGYLAAVSNGSCTTRFSVTIVTENRPPVPRNALESTARGLNADHEVLAVESNAARSAQGVVHRLRGQCPHT